MKLRLLKTGLAPGAFCFLYFFCSSCNSSELVDTKASANSATSIHTDTMMPPESTTVAARPGDMPTLHGKDAIKDSPGVKVNVRQGEFKLKDTSQKQD